MLSAWKCRAVTQDISGVKWNSKTSQNLCCQSSCKQSIQYIWLLDSK